jgi:hypothetical protein
MLEDDKKDVSAAPGTQNPELRTNAGYVRKQGTTGQHVAAMQTPLLKNQKQLLDMLLIWVMLWDL